MRTDPFLTDERDDVDGRDTTRRSRSADRRHGIAALVVAALAAVVALVLVQVTGDDDTDSSTTATTTSAGAAAPVPTVAPTTTTPSVDVPGSLWWLVNASRPLPVGYVPPDLVMPAAPADPDVGAVQLAAPVAAAFDAMVADAAVAGFQLQLNSGYRSFEDQEVLQQRYIEDFGSEVASQLVAEPGTSEHQTGLAADVGLVGLPDDQVFGATDASRWVADNAHRFGFTIRYPPDKAAITGYANEPWHLRYVGNDLAAELHANGLTMEEHFGLVPG